MEKVAVRRVELNNYTKSTRRVLDATVSKFKEACNEILVVVREHWDEISSISGAEEKQAFVEKLIHKTSKNKPLYPLFDKKLYKFPSYYRRAAINTVIGAYSSYQSNLEKYNEKRHNAISNGKKFKEKPPRLESLNKYPVLYKKETYKINEDGSFAIKVFIRNTWDWITLDIPNRDRKDFNRCRAKGKIASPSLVFAYGKYHLDFPIKYSCELGKLPELKNRRALAVDLGINHDAVCSVVCGDGTIESRHFINLASEKDSLDHLINKVKKLQKMSGVGQELTHIHTKIEGVKDNHAKQLASRIAKLAATLKVDVIVFEYLGNMKPKGHKKERIHHWCKRRMQDLVCGLLHRYGIRYAFINPKNTSHLAFDGSGEVVRDNKNFSICKFSTGKVYNCDLNASYNIGARYFIRDYLKSLSESEELQLQAKVPELVKRTNCTLATYRKLLAVDAEKCSVGNNAFNALLRSLNPAVGNPANHECAVSLLYASEQMSGELTV